MSHHGAILAVAFSPDGRRKATGSADKNAGLWKAPEPIRGDPERIMLYTQVITGLDVDELASVRVLDAAEWHACRARLGKPAGAVVVSM